MNNDTITKWIQEEIDEIRVNKINERTIYQLVSAIERKFEHKIDILENRVKELEAERTN
jgi:hypothetical protein